MDMISKMNNHNVVKIEKLVFTSKNKFKWKDLEKELLSFINIELLVDDGNKQIYFDKHTVDELSSSRYNYKLQGKMKLVKANICMYVKELVKNAYNERHQADYNNKHGNLALRGFNRYSCEFEYPNKDATGNIVDYSKYIATIVVRCASDGKDYLYDIIDIKK